MTNTAKPIDGHEFVGTLQVTKSLTDAQRHVYGAVMEFGISVAWFNACRAKEEQSAYARLSAAWDALFLLGLVPPALEVPLNAKGGEA